MERPKHLQNLKNIFDSIICLCAEGPEVVRRQELLKEILDEAVKGYHFCNTYMSCWDDLNGEVKDA